MRRVPAQKAQRIGGRDGRRADRGWTIRSMGLRLAALPVLLAVLLCGCRTSVVIHFPPGGPTAMITPGGETSLHVLIAGESVVLVPGRNHPGARILVMHVSGASVRVSTKGPGDTMNSEVLEGFVEKTYEGAGGSGIGELRLECIRTDKGGEGWCIVRVDYL